LTTWDGSARDGALHDGARHRFPANLVFLFPGRLQQHRLPRQHDVLATLSKLADAERIDLTDVNRRILGVRHVDLRHRAEAALAADLDLVAALVHALDLALDRPALCVGLGDLLTVGRPARQVQGELEPTPGGHDHRLDDVAYRDVDLTVVVGQLLEVDRGLPLAAHIDECRVAPDGDDSALDELPLLVRNGVVGLGLEHGREVFLVLGSFGQRLLFVNHRWVSSGEMGPAAPGKAPLYSSGIRCRPDSGPDPWRCR
jgi:hypothetical protein